MAITAADIRREVKEKNVTFLRLMFSDILGVMKNVEIPATDEQLDKVLSNKAMFDGSSIEGFVRINESDMYLYPDLDTWTVFPWGDENGAVAGLICDIYTSAGEPFAGDPRGNLKKALRHMEEVGYKSFNLGPEPEFFLFKLDEQGNPTLEVNDKGGYFDLAPTDLADNTRREIVNVLTEMGFDVEASHHEVAVGQHEIDFKYTDVLKACDNIQIFKLVVKTIARKHGLYATFMAKPKYGIAGSGMHCNMSLFTEEGNAFFDPEDPRGMQLSQDAYYFLGGLMKHAYNYTAIINPTVNSYKRLVPGYEAPVYIAWAGSNRSPLIRVPASRGMGTRLELRSVDPMANPYLALAVLLEAGLDGTKLMLLNQLKLTSTQCLLKNVKKLVLLICHQHFVTLLKHWKQMKWFVKLWVIISIQTSLMRNVWNGQVMLPSFHNGKLITTWTFINKLNLKIRSNLVFFFF